MVVDYILSHLVGLTCSASPALDCMQVWLNLSPLRRAFRVGYTSDQHSHAPLRRAWFPPKSGGACPSHPSWPYPTLALSRLLQARSGQSFIRFLSYGTSL